MSQTGKIIPFPAAFRKAEQTPEDIEAEQMRRAGALPQWVKDLNVEWIYRELAQRKIDLRT
jgi:hypothetical protein